MCKLILFLP